MDKTLTLDDVEQPPAAPEFDPEPMIERAWAPPRIPRATYRVQLHKEFTFADATRIVPYLARLGISDLYTSPFFKANPGSTHGYDVVDYGELNPEIATRDEFDALVAELRQYGMGLVVDFVPNHMGIASGRNPWWQDVLENGPSSPYAPFFDIEWEQPIKPELQNQVLLPVLGGHYGIVLEQGELRLDYDAGAFTLRYYELPLPVAPPTYPLILRAALPAIETDLAADDLDRLEFQSIVAAFERLPATAEPEAITERQREQLLTKRRLAHLVEASSVVAGAIDAAVTTLNGDPGDPRSFDALDELIGRQHYRLAFWKVAAEEINYRRFFAINDLAAIRQEVPEVFSATHRLLLELVGDGSATGVRIDHPDGLWDPAGYFRNLQRAALTARCLAAAATEPALTGGLDEAELRAEIARWWDARYAANPDDPRLRGTYLVVEKIVEPGEPLPKAWPVDGTVGYEFARLAGGVLVDGRNRKMFDELYGRFTGVSSAFGELVYDKKKLIMRVALASEVNVLARALDRLSEQHRRTRDYTANALRDAMREIIASFPVYRTYVDCDPAEVSARDRAFVQQAVRDAIRRNPASDRGAFEFVRDVLLLARAEYLSDEQFAEQCRFVMKFQQLTGPVMAKGLEDTAFYIYHRLDALNEVGGDPSQFGLAVTEFHRQNAARRAEWPHALLASSTHDTKRSEDVRARIAVLSEIPREWRAALNRWARINRKLKTRVEGSPAPERNDEYLLYQTLIGAWPAGMTTPDEPFVERIVAYAVKAIHEAQLHTSWINPNEEYDRATESFVRGVLSGENERFLTDFGAFLERVIVPGAWNGLAQQLLKLTAPGVPDLYQGTEVWDDSLVDPDNRRPVDFARRERALTEVVKRADDAELMTKLAGDVSDPRLKLLITHAALTLRQDDPELFLQGEYLPLAVSGGRAEHVVAFARRYEGRIAIVAAPRLLSALTRGGDAPIGAVWGDTRLSLGELPAAASYRDVFTGREITPDEGGMLALGELFAAAPIALLRRAD